jgi:hypothetical protein
VTWEEWLLVRKTPLERNMEIIEKVQKIIINEKPCGNCSAWQVDMLYHNQKNTGMDEPIKGFL